MRFLGHSTMEGVEYPPGSLVRRSGKTWHAQVTTRAVPEKGSADWMVYSQDGRDGRDAPAARRDRREPPDDDPANQPSGARDLAAFMIPSTTRTSP